MASLFVLYWEAETSVMSQVLVGLAEKLKETTQNEQKEAPIPPEPKDAFIDSARCNECDAKSRCFFYISPNKPSNI